MEKLFVPYELALKLKDLGLDEECMSFYNPLGSLNLSRIESFNWVIRNSNSQVLKLKYVSAPLWQQVFDWFREKYNLHCTIDEYENPKSWGYLINDDDLTEFFGYSSYEEAKQACLEKLIQIVADENIKN